MTTANEISIRRATADDAGALSVFARDVFDATFGPDNNPDDMRAYGDSAFTAAAQRGEITDPTRRCLLAEVDGTLAGYALLNIGARESGVTGERPVELSRFYVGVRWHGLGVARALMDAMLATIAAVDADTLWLGVWERNARAIRFYEKQGFVDIGSHDFVLGTDVQTDRVMQRVLTARSPR